MLDKDNSIVFLLSGGTYPHCTGGMEIFNFHLIKKLSLDYKVKYLSYEKLWGVDAQHVKLFRARPEKFLLPLQFFIYFMLHLKEKKVVFSYSEGHWLFWLLCYYIIKIFHLESSIILHYGACEAPQPFFVYKRLFSSAKNLVAVSEPIRVLLKQCYSLDAKVIPPLIPFEKEIQTSRKLRESYGIPTGSKVLCMIGSLKTMKNPGHLLSAMELFDDTELREYSPYVVYAGDGHLRPELENKVQQSPQLRNRVLFLGCMPQEKVREIYKLSDVYVICSDFEGTSISLLEAMFNKKTIVAFDVSGIADMLDDGVNALLYEPGDIVQLYENIVRVFKSDKLSKKLGDSAAIQYDNYYSYVEMLEKYKSFL